MQRSEIQNLKMSIKVLKQKPTIVAASKNTEKSKSDESEVQNFTKREKMLSQFILISWGGFLAATAIIITLSKK